MTPTAMDERTLIALLAREAPLPELFRAVVEFLESGPERGTCCISLLDTVGRLRPEAAPRLPSDLVLHLEELALAADAVAPATGRASSFDVGGTPRAGPGWSEQYERFAARGYLACWSAPIQRSDGSVLGTVAEYVREPRPATPSEHGRLETAANILGIAVANAQRKLREGALEAYNEETERNVALGRLARGIAHDLNNILTAVVGHAALGLADIEEERSPRESLLSIQDAAERAADTVRRISSFGRTTPQRRLADIERLLEELEPLLRSALPAAIALHVRSSGAAKAFVDVAQLRCVFVTLCGHAAQGLLGRGSLGIRLERTQALCPAAQRIPPAHPGPYLCVSIMDDGHALEAGIRQSLLETLAARPASDLHLVPALSRAQAVIRAHGGVISARRAADEGNEFCVYLPEAEEPSSDRRANLTGSSST